MGLRLAGVCLLAIGLGCGGERPPVPEGPAAAPAPEEPAGSSAGAGAAQAPEERAEVAAEVAAPTPAAEPVDLLQSVPTRLSVSSAYRDRSRQIPLLVDGDLQTAWNSRSEDLVGSWIAVRLPPEAEVLSIGLTAGFTRESSSGDLFTGNHRIARVRVLRDGEVVGTFPLDTESRALQTLPVEGRGGLYRIEIAEVLPGSRSDWRELCVSELRFMGRAPGAREGAAFPRFGIGEEAEPVAEPPPEDRAAFGRTIRQRIGRFAREWEAYDEELMQSQLNTGDPDISSEEATRFRSVRRQLFGRLAGWVDSVDEVAAAPLRRIAALDPRAAAGGDPWAYSLRRSELDRVDAGFVALADWVGEDSLRCHWAKAHIGLRLARIRTMLRWEQEAGEWEAMQEIELGEDLGPDRDTDRLGRIGDTVEDVLLAWSSTQRAGARRLRRLTLPETSDAKPDWEAMIAQLEIAERSCGWP